MRHFVAVAEELHFRRAAERLGISQPPLSQSIQALEQELEVQLFERNRQRVFLTAAGRLLLERARRILAEVETARLDVRAVVGGGGGDLRVGFTTSASLMPVIHRALHRYRQATPRVRLALREAQSLDLIEALHKRELDVAILRKPGAAQGDHIEFHLVCKDALVVAVHESHPIARSRSVRMKRLREEAFISYPREAGLSLYQESLRTLAKGAAFYPNIVQEARDSSTIIGLVASGLGIAIVPSSLRCIQMEGVCFVGLSDASARSALYVAHRGPDASPSILTFRRLLDSESDRSPRE